MSQNSNLFCGNGIRNKRCRNTIPSVPAPAVQNKLRNSKCTCHCFETRAIVAFVHVPRLGGFFLLAR